MNLHPFALDLAHENQRAFEAAARHHRLVADVRGERTHTTRHSRLGH